MNDLLIKQLLTQPEGISLDFKSEQYVLKRDDIKENVSEPEKIKRFHQKKSELLKDVMAIANTAGQSTGYILLGVKEDPPRTLRLVGLSNEQKGSDSDIQEFIHNHVNEHLQFSYECFLFEGHILGLITIPRQQGLFFSKDKYGIVEAGAIYYRHGSFTPVAGYQEIIRLTNNKIEKSCVSFLITHESGVDMPDAIIDRDFIMLEAPLLKLPDYVEQYHPAMFIRGSVNRNYIRECALYIKLVKQAIPINIRLTNQASFVLSSCELHISAIDSAGNYLELYDHMHESQPPKSSAGVHKLRTNGYAHNFDVQDDGDGSYVLISYEQLLSQRKTSTPLISLMPITPGRITLKMSLYARELSQPISKSISFLVCGDRVAYSSDDLVGTALLLEHAEI